MRPAQPPPASAPPPDRPALLGIAFVLHVVHILLGHGRRLNEALPRKADHPLFPTIAACFGTHDLRRILAHIQRGLLRAMMLERHLLARAAEGYDIATIKPLGRSAAKPLDTGKIAPRAATSRRAPANPDDPLNAPMPTMEELAAQIRRRSISRTIADICLDLGVSAAFCEGECWIRIFRAMLEFDGGVHRFHQVRRRRFRTYHKEGGPRLDTWNFDWRGSPREAFQAVFGWLIDGAPPGDEVAA